MRGSACSLVRALASDSWAVFGQTCAHHTPRPAASHKLVYRLDGLVIRGRNVSRIALRDAGGDRTRVIVCSNEIDRFSDRLLPGLDVRRRIALKRRRALHSQRRETAQEPRLFQDALRMPGIIHIPHEECRFSLM